MKWFGRAGGLQLLKCKVFISDRLTSVFVVISITQFLCPRKKFPIFDTFVIVLYWYTTKNQVLNFNKTKKNTVSSRFVEKYASYYLQDEIWSINTKYNEKVLFISLGNQFWLSNFDHFWSIVLVLVWLLLLIKMCSLLSRQGMEYMYPDLDNTSRRVDRCCITVIITPFIFMHFFVLNTAPCMHFFGWNTTPLISNQFRTISCLLLSLDGSYE